MKSGLRQLDKVNFDQSARVNFDSTDRVELRPGS